MSRKYDVLGHSFVRRLSGDLENHFDDCAKINFDLEDVRVRLFGVGGRTVKKIRQFDVANVSQFAPDVVILVAYFICRIFYSVILYSVIVSYYILVNYFGHVLSGCSEDGGTCCQRAGRPHLPGSVKYIQLRESIFTLWRQKREILASAILLTVSLPSFCCIQGIVDLSSILLIVNFIFCHLF